MSSATNSIDRGIRIALGLASAGALALALGGLVASRTIASGEHALAGAFGIAVDSMENIYCGIPAASSIQAYDLQGEFRWATRIDAAGGVFRLRAVKDGGVEAAAVRNQRVYRLSAGGDLVSSTTRPEAYAEFGPGNESTTVGPSGETYELKSDAIFVRDPDGTIRTVVQQPWWPWRFRRGPTGVLIGLSAAWAALALAWRPAFRLGLARLARLRWG